MSLELLKFVRAKAHFISVYMVKIDPKRAPEYYMFGPRLKPPDSAAAIGARSSARLAALSSEDLQGNRMKALVVIFGAR